MLLPASALHKLKRSLIQTTASTSSFVCEWRLVCWLAFFVQRQCVGSELHSVLELAHGARDALPLSIFEQSYYVALLRACIRCTA